MSNYQFNNLNPVVNYRIESDKNRNVALDKSIFTCFLNFNNRFVETKPRY